MSRQQANHIDGSGCAYCLERPPPTPYPEARYLSHCSELRLGTSLGKGKQGKQRGDRDLGRVRAPTAGCSFQSVGLQRNDDRILQLRPA